MVNNQISLSMTKPLLTDQQSLSYNCTTTCTKVTNYKHAITEDNRQHLQHNKQENKQVRPTEDFFGLSSPPLWKFHFNKKPLVFEHHTTPLNFQRPSSGWVWVFPGCKQQHFVECYKVNIPLFFGSPTPCSADMSISVGMARRDPECSVNI